MVGARLLAYALIPTLAGLPVAVVQLTRAVRAGRDARFELYENGIAHRTAAGRRSWTWGDVVQFQADPEAAELAPSPAPIDGLAQRLGWAFRCKVQFRDGARIRFDEYTTDGPLLVRALLDRRPDAVRVPDGHVHLRIGAAVLPILIVGCAVAVVVMYRYLNGDQEIGDSTLVALSLAMIACIVGVVVGTTAFVFVLLGIRYARR
ncbi:hypothetical protein ABGB16_25700 [Micromonospora sp. B11E3]|uniref:hypothetical protein n=1 Tax=Micromonospora sp. B11E3 TaxID=3153562 RepID=UPI00325E4FF7